MLPRFSLSLGLLIALLLGLAIHHANYLSQPQPHRFAGSVVASGPLLQQAASGTLARIYLQDFAFQERWSSCGAASLRNALVSLGRPVASERALFKDGLVAWLKSLATGMSLDELADLARQSTDGEVDIVRSGSLSSFISILKTIAIPDTRIIVNFDRRPIFGVSIGHFSPLGWYDEDSGLVMILDVTPGFGFTLVPDTLLYQASRSVDPMSNKARGLLVISARKEPAFHEPNPAAAAPSRF